METQRSAQAGTPNGGGSTESTRRESSAATNAGTPFGCPPFRVFYAMPLAKPSPRPASRFAAFRAERNCILHQQIPEARVAKGRAASLSSAATKPHTLWLHRCGKRA